MSYIAACNLGVIGGLVYSTVTEGYAAGRLGRMRDEACENLFVNSFKGGAVGVLLNTGVQAAIQFSACVFPEKQTHPCSSSTYLNITCLALPCICAAAYLFSKVCSNCSPRNYAPLPRAEEEMVPV